ncbi:IS3 family transposase [Lentimicrobium sp. S6]|uniref:IS3 family transposase n=1 Tax=Lentimicrobium sp. S6 TaxID=2735872 RepID=UPI001552E486|nr:IS3 family transposase [Lentimicrobium sp. S6]NPD46751.1 IS3 family transposase [Lentimicrobium sp. S6]
MNKLYRAAGISKQAFHKWLDRKNMKRSVHEQLLSLVYQIRDDHPTMGVRDMYYKLQPDGIGRDAFEIFCENNDLMASRPRNYRKTTDSSGVIRFDNLLENINLTGVNQAWQSDITYFEVNGKFYYITFILDSFSRKIVGYQTSKRLLTEHTTLPALEMAIKDRQNQNLSVSGIIFHSDGGGQYYDKNFLKLTAKYEFRNSMCEYAWENGKAERLNGVIKNNYLIHRKINNYEDLVKEVDRAVKLYNEEKPHISLGRKTPLNFESNYLTLIQNNSTTRSNENLNYKSIN